MTERDFRPWTSRVRSSSLAAVSLDTNHAPTERPIPLRVGYAKINDLNCNFSEAAPPLLSGRRFRTCFRASWALSTQANEASEKLNCQFADWLLLRNVPSFAVAWKNGIGSSDFNADVK